VYIETDIARHSCAPGGQIGEQTFVDVLGRHAKSKKAALAGLLQFAHSGTRESIGVPVAAG